VIAQFIQSIFVDSVCEAVKQAESETSPWFAIDFLT